MMVPNDRIARYSTPMLRMGPIGWRAGIETPWLWGAVTSLSFSVSCALQLVAFWLTGVVVMQSHLPFHLELLFAWGVAAFLWSSARAAGRVGEGSDAGLRLAIYALASRDVCETLVLLAGAEGYDVSHVPLGTIVTWLRHGTLATFGYGLALAATASVIDFVRRRRHAAWMLGPYRHVEPPPFPAFIDNDALPPRMRGEWLARARTRRHARSVRPS